MLGLNLKCVVFNPKTVTEYEKLFFIIVFVLQERKFQTSRSGTKTRPASIVSGHISHINPQKGYSLLLLM